MRAPSTTRLAPAPERRAQLGRRAQLLAGASVAYNVVEAVVAVAAGAAASSIALIGFGLDSLVEVGSGLVILWQFRHRMPETRERQALRFIGISFFALAAYVTVESVRGLLGGAEADHSTLGIWVAVLSLSVMPVLSWAQRRTGQELGSGSVVADSKQTLLCTYLSAVLLLGLLANSLVGWWWADPLAGLVIAGVAAREGLEAWRGEACGCGPVAVDTDVEDAGAGPPAAPPTRAPPWTTVRSRGRNRLLSPAKGSSPQQHRRHTGPRARRCGPPPWWRTRPSART